MMEWSMGRLDYWRSYFGQCNSDIFGVIENAILVASLDCPMELLKRRDSIAEKLFACRSTRCVGCGGEGEEMKGRGDGCGEKGGGGLVSNYSYDEAEALTEEIEEEGQTVGEVLRIKELLTSKEFKSESLLFDSLRRLQLMGLSVETLKVTEIGKIVNGLKKHGSKQIRQLTRTLIDGWKAMVEEWANSTADLADATPESANPSSTLDQWEGLPLPPLDEGALLVTTGMELSQFFEGMDEDGNLRSSCGFEDTVDAESIHSEERNDDHTRKQESHAARHPENKKAMTMTQDLQCMQIAQTKSQNKPKFQCKQPLDGSEKHHKQPKCQNVGSGSATLRPPRPVNDLRITWDARPQVHPNKPIAAANDKASTGDDSVREKLEIAKRRLHEGYQQAETAKRQRTIQVMELQDLPKQGLGDRQQLHQRQIGGNRYWANRRA